MLSLENLLENRERHRRKPANRVQEIKRLAEPSLPLGKYRTPTVEIGTFVSPYARCPCVVCGAKEKHYTQECIGVWERCEVIPLVGVTCVWREGILWE